MAEPIEIPITPMRYDITMPLLDGRVQVEGVKLIPTRSAPNGTNVRADGPFVTGDFGIVDMNVANWLPSIEVGWEVVGLPIFSKRKPVYEYLWVRSDRGINTPKDLEGKRVGIRRFRVSTSIWITGLLGHFHGVDKSKLKWVVSADSLDDPFGEFIYAGAQVEMAADPKKSAVSQLLDGDVDALMNDISDGATFKTLDADPRVKQLFTDCQAEDYRLYRETGIFTPAHVLVMSKKLDREHPDLAGKLYQGFEHAKAIAYEDILNDRAGFSVIYLRAHMVEQQKRWGDPFKYGVTASKPDIDAWIQYNHEQNMTRTALSYEQAFASSTLDT
jgi:4,5-dihydroxyphthalate decarboxylase